MGRQSSRELIVRARTSIQAASDHLFKGEFDLALSDARRAFQAARAQRSHRLVSETWLFLLDTMAEVPDVDVEDYRDVTEGAFRWGETMPEEIQVWFFARLDPHLVRIKDELLIRWAREHLDRAKAWRGLGNVNITTRLAEIHLKDQEAGVDVDRRALSLERMGAFYADELFDPEGNMLLAAAERWRNAGRLDRATALEELVAQLRNRQSG